MAAEDIKKGLRELMEAVNKTQIPIVALLQTAFDEMTNKVKP